MVDHMSIVQGELKRCPQCEIVKESGEENSLNRGFGAVQVANELGVDRAESLEGNGKPAEELYHVVVGVS
jgi:hypothetical protein